MPKATEAARRAVALDPSLAEAHCALAATSLTYAWDRAVTEREFARAIQLNPKDIQALCWYGCFYLQLSEGRLMEGMEQVKSALASDSLSGYAHAVYALTCNIAGKTAESVEVSRRAVQLDCESSIANWVLQMVLVSSGQFEAAVVAGESALAMSGRRPWSMALLAMALADLGRVTEADAVYCEMQARARREYVQPTSLAFAAAAAARKRHRPCVERELDTPIRVILRRSQRHPFVRGSAGKIVLGEIGPIIGCRVIRAKNRDRSVIALASESVGGREARGAPSDDNHGSGCLRPFSENLCGCSNGSG
jgi:Flp pilus assembly protein TadD